MLRLLAQREQGYDDIAALMGLSVEQVRERVKEALSQLEEEGSGEPRPAGPVAAGESPAEPVPAPPPAPREPSPQAAPAPQDQPAAKSAKRQGSGLPKLSLPDSQGARAAIAAGVAALVVLVVVLIVGGGGDGGSDSTTVSGSAPTGADGQPTSGGGKELTKAVLDPVGGSEATGVAIFGRVKNSLALQVEAEGLKPTAKGSSYAIWLSQSPQKMLPLASTAVGQDGRIATQFQVPAEVVVYLADETFNQIAITETENSTLKASLNKATSEETAPSYTGTEVLRGTITGPIIGAAKRGE